MSFLRDPEGVVVGKKKVIDYMLNIPHPDNSGKAKLLIRHGFHPENWEVFVKSVVAHAKDANIISELETPFGKKLILEGKLETHRARSC